MKQSLCLLEIEPLFAVNRGSIRGHAVFFLVFFLTKNRTAKRTPHEGGSTACLAVRFFSPKIEALFEGNRASV